MIVGTAGHIDHGKSTLVRALTGVDTDRLKEEKSRGISIELGYAYLPSPDGQILGFIDVPGHEKLVHTMVAGASGIDFGLLVIAADDGVMPQTREHLAILELVGVTRGAVALSKIDRVDAGRAGAVTAEIRALLSASALRDAPVFPVNASAPGDEGTRSLRDHLFACAHEMPARRHDGLFRLAVDRVFTLPGHGTVVTGTVFSGALRVGAAPAPEESAADTSSSSPGHDATLVLAPAGTPVRVRSLHAQNRAASMGVAGQRCALNLAGIETRAIERGDWIADTRAFLPSTRLDVDFHLLADAGDSLKAWAPLHIHWGAARRLAHVVPLSGDTLAPGRRGRVQLVFDRPACAAAGDRFIARNAQATRTVGGGVVLDPNAPDRKRRSPARLAWLDAVQDMLRDGSLEPVLAQAPLGLSIAAIERLAGLPFDKLALPADALRLSAAGAGGATAVVILRRHWDALRQLALAALRQFHDDMPDEPGADMSRLRRMASPALSDSLLRMLVEGMLRDGDMQRNGPWLHLPDHGAVLSDADTALARQLLPQLSAGGFDPPWVRDLARMNAQPEDRVRTLLRKLMRRGDASQIVRDLFYHRDRIRELAALLSRLAQPAMAGDAPRGVEAAAFRDATGLGRKRAVQILEFFDRVGYTRRVRDLHIPRPDTQWSE